MRPCPPSLATSEERDDRGDDVMDGDLFPIVPGLEEGSRLRWLSGDGDHGAGLIFSPYLIACCCIPSDFIGCGGVFLCV